MDERDKMSARLVALNSMNLFPDVELVVKVKGFSQKR
jgi:hypothetical protein